MASSSFRDSMNSLGWSRREEPPVNTSQQRGLLSSIKSLNPFGDGYVQLPTTEGSGAPLPAPSRREEEEGFFACESTFGTISQHIFHPTSSFHIRPKLVSRHRLGHKSPTVTSCGAGDHLVPASYHFCFTSIWSCSTLAQPPCFPRLSSTTTLHTS